MPASAATDLLDRVDRFIRERDLLTGGQTVVVGISGGVDSIVLAHVLHRLGYELIGVHVNYGLRDEAADADEAFVRAWARRLDPPVPVRVAHRDPRTRAATHGASVQEVARMQRYAFMAACASAAGTDRVAVGHHRNDQAETLLLNLFRGSGIEGLGGMAPRRPMATAPTVDLVRPLLPVARSTIAAYAAAHDLDWRTDASNQTLHYDRNTIRHAVLPVIEEHFGGATGRIADAAGRVRAYLTETLVPELERRFARCATQTPEGGRLRLAAWRDQPPVWRRRLVLEALQRWLDAAPYTAAVARAIETLDQAQVGKRVELGAGTIWRERGALQFVRAGAEPPTVGAHRVRVGEAVALPQGVLRVERLDSVPDRLDAGAPLTVYADADALRGPLHVRTWQPGDRFQPLGMTHTKTVADVLTDERVPPHRRAGVLVLEDTVRIVWVVGYRLAHPVRIRASTRQGVRLAFTPRASVENA